MAEHGSNAFVDTWRKQAQIDREAIAPSLLLPLPKNVLSIVSCEAAYILHPSAIPLSNLKFADLRACLRHEYDLHFESPALNPALLDRDRNRLSADDLGQMLLDGQSPEMEFNNGLLRISDGRAIKIQALEITRERILAKVLGPTIAAETLIRELVPLLWALAGINAPWSEIQRQHQKVLYGAATRVKMQNEALPLLSPGFGQLLKLWCLPAGIGVMMGSRDQYNDWNPAPDSHVRFNLDEVHVLFHVQTATGLTETARLRIGVDAKHERGTGVITVSTQLAYPEHLDLVEQLLELT